MTNTTDTETITNAQWDSAVVRIEKQNLRKWGQSPSRATISAKASHLIHEISSNGTMVVSKDWRDTLKRYGLIT